MGAALFSLVFCRVSRRPPFDEKGTGPMRHFLKRPAAAPGILAAHSPFTSLTLAVLSVIALGAAPLHDANAAEADDEAVDAEAAAGSQDASQNPASAEEADLFLPEVVVSADPLNGLESGVAGSGGA